MLTKSKLILTIVVILSTFIVLLSIVNSAIEEEYSKIPYESEQSTVYEIPLDNSIFESRFAYKSLTTDADRELYANIYYSLIERRESNPIYTDNIDYIYNMYNYVMIDNPDIFYVDGIDVTTHKTTDHTSCIVQANYTMTAYDVELTQRAINMAVEDIVRSIPNNYDDVHKVFYVYEYIIQNTEYVPVSQNNQNIVSVLLNKSSVCQGYAKTFQYLMYELGVPCTLVTGTVGDEQINHAWNMIRIEDMYYHVDVTWGDMQDYDVVCYDFLLIDDSALLDTHTIESDIVYPKCVSTEHNYYVVMDTLVKSEDTEHLSKILPRINTSENPTLTLKFETEALFNFYKAYLIDEANLFDYMDGPIDYVLNSTHRTLSIERRF